MGSFADAHLGREQVHNLYEAVLYALFAFTENQKAQAEHTKLLIKEEKRAQAQEQLEAELAGAEIEGSLV